MKRSLFLGWWQVAICLAVSALSGGMIGAAFSVIVVPIGETFQSSRMVLMLPVTLYALAIGLFSPIFGAAMERYSIRHLMLCGVAFLSLGWLLLSFTTSITQVIVVYALMMGAGSTLLGTLISAALLSRWFVKKRGLALGIAAMGIAAGTFFFPPIMQLLIQAFDWRVAFRLFALISVLFVPAILILVVNRPADRRLYPDGDAEPSEGANQSVAGSAAPALSTRAVLTNPTFWIIGVLAIVVTGGSKGLASNLVPLALDVGTAPSAAALLISCCAVGSFTGQTLFAALADRIDQRILMSGICVLMSLAMLCCWQGAVGYPVLVAGCVLMGMSGGGMLPLWGLLISRSFGAEYVGRVMGVMILALLPVNMAVAPLFGRVYDVAGSYGPALLVLACANLAVIPLLPYIRAQASPRPAPGAPVAAAAP